MWDLIYLCTYISVEKSQQTSHLFCSFPIYEAVQNQLQVRGKSHPQPENERN